MSEATPMLARQALAVAPATAAGWRVLAFMPAGAAGAAAIALARALASEPLALDFSNLAELRRQAGLAGAGAAARRAVVLDPALAAAHLNRGNLAMQDGRVVEADRSFARALAAAPASREALYNRAAARHELGDPAAAVALYERVLARTPDFFEARWNRALALLAAGRWREGWRAHECRRQHPLLRPRDFGVPEWTGGPLAGRRLLLAAEQGLGDTIQFLRYVPAVAALGARIVLELPAALTALARALPVERLVVSGEPVGDVELQAPLMSLPLLLDAAGAGSPPAAPPAPPYLVADADRRARWRARLGDDARPRVGIAWAGNKAHRYDHRRSLPDAALAPLAALDHLRIVSLQKDRAAPAGWLDVRGDLGDLADTAALMAELDLVVAVDTAVAHLAGALAKPLWVLLSPVADWRWPHGLSRTPWYPDAELIWQPAEEAPDWGPTIARLAARLVARSRGSGVRSRDDIAARGLVPTPDSRSPTPGNPTPGNPTPDSCHSEGTALWRAGRLDEALDGLGRCLDAHPEDGALRTSFGLVLDGLGLKREAAAAWRQALAFEPAQAPALVNLANAAADAAAGNAHGAGARPRLLCRRALAIDAADVAALGNLGVHEERRGGHEQARRLYRRALALDPGRALLWSNLGSLEHWQGRLVLAGCSLDRALAVDPAFAAARFDRAINRLLQGDETRGLADYEWRWRRPSPPRPQFGLPAWDGAPLAGRRLLLWAEQGFGDAIQFARFAARVPGGGKALLCQAPLLRLMRTLAGIDGVAAYGDSVPAADVEAPLLSLPYRLGLSLRDASMTGAYLAADAGDLARWRPFLDGLPQGVPRIGVVWAGRGDYAQDRARSLPAAALAPLLAVAGFAFVSLQHEEREDGASPALASLRRPRRFVDFADTAALIAGLDLVIAADTAVAHLAGALAKPVWLLLPKVPDWRWGIGGTTTPWYPTARLFRQSRAGDWRDVVAAVAAALPAVLKPAR